MLRMGEGEVNDGTIFRHPLAELGGRDILGPILLIRDGISDIHNITGIQTRRSVDTASLIIARAELTESNSALIQEEILVRDILTTVKWNDEWIQDDVLVRLIFSTQSIEAGFGERFR